jgi:hypothetical protein
LWSFLFPLFLFTLSAFRFRLLFRRSDRCPSSSTRGAVSQFPHEGALSHSSSLVTSGSQAKYALLQKMVSTIQYNTAHIRSHLKHPYTSNLSRHMPLSGLHIHFPPLLSLSLSSFSFHSPNGLFVADHAMFRI